MENTIIKRHTNVFILGVLLVIVGQLPLIAFAESDSNAVAVEPNSVLPKGDLFNKAFTQIFENYVNEQGMVNYEKLRMHRLELSAILAQVAMLDRSRYESWGRNEQIAFWINVYNVSLLDIIIRNYPIESNRFRRLWWPPQSIRHIDPIGVVGSPKWDRFKFIVMDEEFTLSEIENRFFRSKFKDPRIFMALHCASLGGPQLRNEPFYGRTLDSQLDEQTKKYINSPAGVDIKQNKGIVYLSVLFSNRLPWFGMEFAQSYAIDRKFKSHPPQTRAVLNFISNYLPTGKVSYLETGNYKIEFKVYDWRLNQN